MNSAVTNHTSSSDEDAPQLLPRKKVGRVAVCQQTEDRKLKNAYARERYHVQRTLQKEQIIELRARQETHRLEMEKMDAIWKQKFASQDAAWKNILHVRETELKSVIHERTLRLQYLQRAFLAGPSPDSVSESAEDPTLPTSSFRSACVDLCND